jgi:universal stress protein E
MKLILVAVDLSERSMIALRRAVDLASVHDANVRVLHVVDDDQPAGVVEAEVRQAADVVREAAAAAGAPLGVDPEIRVQTGEPFQEIVAAAANGQADLIVMGSHRRRILGDIFTGTTIERVIRSTDVPVLMANRPEPGRITKVVAAADLSDAAAAALKAVHSLGLLSSNSVTVVHAVAPTARTMMSYAGVERQRIEEDASRELETARRNLLGFLEGLELQDLRFDLRVAEGEPYDAIRRVVDRERTDLLVIGTRGLTSLRRLLLGSVAQELLAKVETDILVVAAPRRA